jgi:hypothetical protein
VRGVFAHARLTGRAQSLIALALYAGQSVENAVSQRRIADLFGEAVSNLPFFDSR